jgi:NADH:ubiquinone oxidoreductase subunit E
LLWSGRKSIFPGELDAYIETLNINIENPRRKDTLIQTLHKAQEIFGYLPDVVQIHIRRALWHFSR